MSGTLLWKIEREDGERREREGYLSRKVYSYVECYHLSFACKVINPPLKC